MRKHIILFALLASALTGCGDTSVSSPTAPDLKALSRSMPVEEQHAYRFAGLLLQGDYAQIYQLILEVDPRFSVPEATVAGVLGMTFGYLSAGVATCGGLDTLVLADTGSHDHARRRLRPHLPLHHEEQGQPRVRRANPAADQGTALERALGFDLADELTPKQEPPVKMSEVTCSL